jgi:3-methyladenine DNA glycosylase Tag
MTYDKKIKVESLADYMEAMSESVFQTGISWRVVEAKWPGIKKAFYGFDPEVISRLTFSQIADLARDARVIRNHRKIAAIVANGYRLLALDKQYGGFRNYLRSFGSYDALAADLRKQFKFLGDTGIYRFLYVVGEEVPPWEAWSAAHGIKWQPAAHQGLGRPAGAVQ